MLEDRDIRLDLAALALVVFVAFLTLSLLTFDPADPPVPLVAPFDGWFQQDLLVYPVSETTSNACGRWGALASAMLFDGLGLGAYYLVGSLAVWTVFLLMRREMDSPLLRLVGWVLSLMGLTTLCAMLVPSWTPGTVLGSGGAWGALGAGVLRYYFADVGGFLLATSALVAGLLLCTDYVLVHLGLFLGTITLSRITDVWHSRAASDDPASIERAPALSVRVGGRTMKLLAPEDGAQDEFADDEDVGEEEDDDYGVEGDDEDDDDTLDGEVDGDEEALDEEDEDYEEDEAPGLPAGEPAMRTASGVRSSSGELRGASRDSNKQLACPGRPSQGEDSQPTPGDAADGAPQVRGRDRRRRLAALRVRRPSEEPEDREAVMHQLDEASSRDGGTDYELPHVDLLMKGGNFDFESQAKEVRRKARILEKTFASFGYDVKVVEIDTGPVIAQYEVQLEAGLRLAKITGLADDLAIALRVPSVRIVAPIPGKNTVGIEVPNEERQLVHLREVMQETNGRLKKMRIPLFLGKDVSGNPLTVDLSTLPHLLIAGRTGTGKSVCLNAIIASILMTRRPDEVRMLMIDPKMVELSGYRSLPHLMHPVVTDMRKAEAILAWAVEKMEERYAILAQAGVRHVSVYNQLSEEELMDRFQPQSEEERREIPRHMPYIVIVADEMADLMMTAGKEVEQHIIRLAQKSRAVGIHLILATQKPTVDVITGLIKSNLPARIAFQVASRTDSRVVLDEMGADKLLGNGDMLFLYPGTSTLIRGQGTYLSDEEINLVVEAASQGEQQFVTELVQLKVDDPPQGNSPAALKQRDELYEQAIEIVLREGRGSCSLLQRAMGIGYGRAARLIDFMAEDGIVGAYAGSQAREVLMTLADFQRLQQGDTNVADTSAATTDDRTAAPPRTAPRLHREPPTGAETLPRTKRPRSDMAATAVSRDLTPSRPDKAGHPSDGEFEEENEVQDDLGEEDPSDDVAEDDEFDADDYDEVEEEDEEDADEEVEDVDCEYDEEDETEEDETEEDQYEEDEYEEDEYEEDETEEDEYEEDEYEEDEYEEDETEEDETEEDETEEDEYEEDEYEEDEYEEDEYEEVGDDGEGDMERPMTGAVGENPGGGHAAARKTAYEESA